jgi:hypothetical protein
MTHVARSFDPKYLPSRKKPPLSRRMKVPEGLIELWRVSTNMTASKTWDVICVTRNCDYAFALADAIYVHSNKWSHVHVEHKAGVEVNGHLYVVNLRASKETVPSVEEVSELMSLAKSPTRTFGTLALFQAAKGSPGGFVNFLKKGPP